MEKKQAQGLFKHIDFVLLDILCLQGCFILSYWINTGRRNPYRNTAYQFQAMVLMASQLIVILFFEPHRDILRRSGPDEFVAVFREMAETILIALVYLFFVHRSSVASRLQFGYTSLSFICIDVLLRMLNKLRIFKSLENKRNLRSLVLVTSAGLVDKAMQNLLQNSGYCDFFLSKILVLDDLLSLDGVEEGKYAGIPVERLSTEAVSAISHEWVDEVFILQPGEWSLSEELLEDLMTMGMTVSYSAEAICGERWSFSDVKKLGNYDVLTSSMRFASPGQLMAKRLMDIVGGLLGCILTGILTIFLGPAIYFKSPGPIFFKQKRVGKNGKIFNMYKFRSMYMDAEERKAALMAQNKIADGMMFKMDDDPRIIGSEKKGKDGKPKGIGNFIRNTSLDEFPQFFNVLTGSMSLVGTRPPTLDEWQNYDLKHRVRMTIKPGITGMWQISGRSEITDFNEVVRLDRKYIEEWSLLQDLKILCKTVVVVVARKGAE